MNNFASCFPFSSFSLYAIPLFLLTPLPIVLSLSLFVYISHSILFSLSSPPLHPSLCCSPHIFLFFLFFSSSIPLVAMYREPSLHDVGEAVPKLAGGPPSKSTTSEPVVMNGGKPVNKPDKEET